MMAVRLETPVEYKAGISYWRRPPTVHEPALTCAVLALGKAFRSKLNSDTGSMAASKVRLHSLWNALLCLHQYTQVRHILQHPTLI
jgi:hypothetical protein